MLDINEYLRQQRQLLSAGDDVSTEEANRMMKAYWDSENQRANENLFGNLKLKWSANDIRNANNTPVSNVNPPSDMSTPQQNMNPFIGRNMSPQQIINMAYRLGGGTYEGAVKAASRYGINLHQVVKERNASKAQARQVISNTVKSITAPQNLQDTSPQINPSLVQSNAVPSVQQKQTYSYTDKRNPSISQDSNNYVGKRVKWFN